MGAFRNLPARLFLAGYLLVLPSAHAANKVQQLCLAFMSLVGGAPRSATVAAPPAGRLPRVVSASFENGLPQGTQVLAQLGEGAYGVVHHARIDNREVSLKVLIKPDAESIVLLRREAEANARLARVATVYQGRREGEFALAYDHVPGIPLHKYLAQTPLTPFQAEALIAQVRIARERLRAAGIVHNDFKEANLIVAPDGTIHPIDLGMVGFSHPADIHPFRGYSGGTPLYMSLEQMRGRMNRPENDDHALLVVEATIRGYARKSPEDYLVRFPGLGQMDSDRVSFEVYEVLRDHFAKSPGVAEFRYQPIPEADLSALRPLSSRFGTFRVLPP